MNDESGQINTRKEDKLTEKLAQISIKKKSRGNFMLLAYNKA
jgi:hypothetical protein